MHIPLHTAQLVEEILPLLATLTCRECELALCDPLADRRPQLAPEHRHHHPHRQQKAVPHRHPLARLTQPATRHQTVEMRMQAQRLAPGMQRHDDPGLAAEILSIAQQLQ
jgi:hypothetical protein